MMYSRAITFVKRDNLLQWLRHSRNTPVTSTTLDMYARERDIQLVLWVRYDNNNDTYCKISCPINPLPIKGEFKAASLSSICEFLQDNGWVFVNNLPLTLMDR